jgi:pathogenesis-related protein 1
MFTKSNIPCRDLSRIFLVFIIVVGLVVSETSRADGKLTGTEKSAMLDAHNQARQKVNVPALKWSKKLAKYASVWAKYLKKENTGQMQHRPNSGKYKQKHGENLFWGSPVNWSDGNVEIQEISSHDVVSGWESENKDYDPKTGQCRKNQVCGHYTQVVWRDTHRVGCAMVINKDKSQTWVCNYSPPGNWVGEKPY